jgi:formate-dependent nitrite reductase membrane component NrfD
MSADRGRLGAFDPQRGLQPDGGHPDGGHPDGARSGGGGAGGAGGGGVGGGGVGGAGSTGGGRIGGGGVGGGRRGTGRPGIVNPPGAARPVSGGRDDTGGPGARAGTGPHGGPETAGPGGRVGAGPGGRGTDRESSSYYGRPILNPPTWAAADIAGYFFLGGLAGASSLLAAGAQAARSPALARTAKVGAAVAIGGSLAALIHDLGRPERFLNMLRVIKPTSPMSVGSWLLTLYVPAAGAAAASAVTGRAPRIGGLATGATALLGPVVVGYTAVLIGDTAVPAWQDGYRELPFVFAGSAAAAAGGLGMLGAPLAQAGPARRTAAFGAALDLVANRLMRHRLGMVAQAYETGRAGRLMRAAQALTVAGALGGVTLGRTSRPAAVCSGVALLAGSLCTRFGVFEAGMASARDPAYTVVPQRIRRDLLDRIARRPR